MLKCYRGFALVLMIVIGVKAFAVYASAPSSLGGNYVAKNSGSVKSENPVDILMYRGDPCQVVIGVNDTRPQVYDELASLVIKTGGKDVSQIRAEEKIIAVVVDVPMSNLSSLLHEVTAAGLSRYVEPNLQFKIDSVPNDPYYGLQWAPKKIQADWAWNTTTGNSSLIVGVIDTGVDYTHLDISANYLALGYDWVNSDNNPIDDNGHGTHVAGTIAAVLDNSVGIAGIAQVGIMAEKGLNDTGWGLETNLANAIIHAVNQGARILSNSWGSESDSWLIHDAVKYAYNHGVLVLAAAGNSNTNVKHYPAAYDEVVAVAATNQFDEKATFSSWGNWIAVSAPGVQILSTMPTYHVTLNDEGYNMNYDYASGTSTACPHAAGVAALIWSRYPNATANWVRGQLAFTADDLGDPGFDVIYGDGRINARRAVEQEPLQHDLFMFRYDRPRVIQPGDFVPFDITVLNFGLNNETNFDVSLIVDGNVVDSMTIPVLLSGSFATVTFFWNPLESLTYNVTFYVSPVAGETVVTNNVISAMISAQFMLTLNPTRGPVGTGVTVTGIEFTPDSQVAITFNDMFMGYAATDTFGDFTFTFNVPFSTADTWVVKAFDINVLAEANFTVLDTMPMNIQMDTGTVHFRGEIATFFIYTVFHGSAVNSTITNALLYKPDGSSEDVTTQQIGTGLYKASYSLPNDAQAGSYVLIINASFSTDTIQSEGTALKSFLVSQTLSAWNPLLISVNESIGALQTDIGLVNVRLDTINATLARIEDNSVTLNSSLGIIKSDLDTIGLKVTAINGTTATIETVLGQVNGTVTSIKDEKATIIIQGIGQVEQDISSLRAERETWTIPQYAIFVFTLVAAVAAVLSVLMLTRRKLGKEEQKDQAPSTPPSPAPSAT